jgi:hypothetical protein
VKVNRLEAWKPYGEERLLHAASLIGRPHEAGQEASAARHTHHLEVDKAEGLNAR